MPMRRELYPPNWGAIALDVKNRADWKCQECGKPCLRPGDDWGIFKIRVLLDAPNFYKDTFILRKAGDDGEWLYVPKKGRFILTVAHLNHDPGDNRRENLKALCSVCHLKYDQNHHVKNAKKTRHHKKHLGQLNLFDGTDKN